MTQAHTRRLSDKIIAAFEQACERGDAHVAEHLLHALEAELTGHGGPNKPENRYDLAPLATAYAAMEKLRARRDVA